MLRQSWHRSVFRSVTLLEHIAAVLHRARLDGGWDDEDVAAKVLREMREPTPRMIDRGGAADDHSTQYVQCESADVHWRAMIDGALNETLPLASTDD